MIDLNFEEVKIFEDSVSEIQVLKKLIEKKEGEEPFHILNIGDIFKKHQLWLRQMPRVVPYYAVKCNPDPFIIKIIAALGGNFDCATKQEIIQVMSHGVSGDRIIFANPLKFPSHIEYAKKVGIALMTADTEDELKTIKKIYPKAKILIRIKCDAKVAGANLGEKFGCDPHDEAVQLIRTTVKLNLDLHGFSFHVGSPCGEVLAICRGISACKKLIDIAKSMGCQNVKMIDIGGGIPGERDFNLSEFSDVINDTLKDIDPDIQIIAEPGRYYVTSATVSTAYLLGKKTIMKEGEKTFMYYVSDGVYGSFIEELLNIRARLPISVNNPTAAESEKKYKSTIWGPTCDSYDLLIKDKLLPEFNIGDWLAWTDIGSYSTSLANEFNGFKPAKVYPVVWKSDWDALWTEIKKISFHKNQEDFINMKLKV